MFKSKPVDLNGCLSVTGTLEHHHQHWAFFLFFYCFPSWAFGDHDTGLANEKLNDGLVYNPSQVNLMSAGKGKCLWKCLHIKSSPINAAIHLGFSTIRVYDNAALSHATRNIGKKNKLTNKKQRSYLEIFPQFEGNCESNMCVEADVSLSSHQLMHFNLCVEMLLATHFNSNMSVFITKLVLLSLY